MGGGLIGIWEGLTGAVGGFPDRLNDSFNTLKWLGVGSLVVVGGAIIIISLSFFTGKQDMAAVVRAIPSFPPI